MKSRGLVVPRARGEELRRQLLSEGLLRTDLEIRREGGSIVLPLSEGADVPSDVGRVEEREFEVRRKPGPRDYRELTGLPPAAAALLPRSFDVIGEIVLIRVPDTLESEKGRIGEALLAFVPGVRIVGADRGVHGTDRRRKIERIAGAGGWRTLHRENGVDIEVDVEAAYFSPRLAREHARVAGMTQTGERVYDLCCGVGPFSLTLARDRRAAEIVAVDSNTSAIDLLDASLLRLPGRDRVRSVRRPLEEFLPSAPPVERVIFNLPLEGIKYLPSVARTVARRGRLHYYEVVPRAQLALRKESMMRSLGTDDDWALEDEHIVHPYSPTSDLWTFILRRSPTGGPSA